MAKESEFVRRPNSRFRELVLGLPADWWKRPEVALRLTAAFQSHVVALSVVVTRGEAVSTELFTGFLLKRRGWLQWITAAHVIEDLQRIRTDSGVKVRSARWHDNYSNQAAAAIPTSIETLIMKFFTPDEIDIGVVWFNQHDADLIASNRNVRPLTATTWRHNARANPEGLFVVGLPRPWRRERLTRAGRVGSYSVEAGIIALPVVSIVDPRGRDQSLAFWRHPHCIYGEVRLPRYKGAAKLDDIKGMSGGPLLSIERTRDGGLKYRLWGIQSAWLPSERIIRAEPIAAAVKLIDTTHKAYDQWVAERKRCAPQHS